MQAAILPGGRLHLHDGPIDLVIGADGSQDAVRAAYAAACRRFATVLDELCAELPLLREPMRVDAPLPSARVAREMDRATRALCADRFITRMAAVAGAVADEILAAMCRAAFLTRAYVNNGGDIALHLAPGAIFEVGLVSGSVATPTPALLVTRTQILPVTPALAGTTRVTHADPVRGIATSGFGGRSHSLGIADAVTILAANAAAADAAATLVANAVDLPGHPAITRVPASDLDPQSDLGARRVTRHVGALSPAEIAAALENGIGEAERLRAEGHLVVAALSLRGAIRTVGPLPVQRTSLSHAV